ncbi:MAG: hypothetical protein ACKOKC_16250 [Chthoniobacterales bacterium]
MKAFLLITALLLSPAFAQFGWDEEPAVDTDMDGFNAALRTPVIEPIRPIEPVIEPIVPVFQPFVAPVIDVDPLVEQCDLEPEVAQVYRAAEIDEDDGDCPEHRSAVRSGWIPQTGPAGRHERERRSQFLGRLSANPYASDSTANPYSSAGSPYSARSVNNPFGPYGSPYSSTSARNPYATDAPKIVAQDGPYLGELSDNPYDPDSVANPYGRYGSPYSSTSINNPYSTYGSPYSSQSPNNPFATQAPLLFGD